MSDAVSEKQVLDASALLAWLLNEPGVDQIEFPKAIINSVNWSEVVQKAEAHGVKTQSLRKDLEALGLRFTSFGLEEGEVAARLFPKTKNFGLSSGDRACLATAKVYGGVAVTADRIWQKLKGVKIKIIR